MNQSPLFSVIVPTYHRNDLLRRCLEALSPSVQTLPSHYYEVIVTDDGKNTTAEALIRDEFPWVRWVKGPQKGVGYNRNSGASHARGEWLVFSDDDCIPETELMMGYKNAIAAESPHILAYEGKITCKTGIPSPMYEAPLNSGGCFWSCNIMLHRDLFHKLNGFDVGFSDIANEDSDMRERIKHQGYAICFVADATVDHPARPVRGGAGRGRHYESVIRMWYLTGNTSASQINVKVFKMLLTNCLVDMKEYPMSKDTLKYLWYVWGQFIYVGTHLQQWNRQYEKAFFDKKPPYLYPY